jgi:tripartite-type tricarboxylate transporter receptor subunit TctC
MAYEFRAAQKYEFGFDVAADARIDRDAVHGQPAASGGDRKERIEGLVNCGRSTSRLAKITFLQRKITFLQRLRNVKDTFQTWGQRSIHMHVPGMSRGVVAALLAFGAMAAPAAAQSYPTRQVTVIVPFAAGGPTDVIARIVTDHMSRTLGQSFVIENVVGAGGTTGITRAKRATADGYTIAMGHMGTHAAAPALYANLAYDPAADFEPIGMAAGTPILILARKDFPPKDLKEFVAYVKANEKKLNMAHAGVGSVSFTTCLLLNHILGVKPTSVPYQGTGPSMNALVGGQVDYMCDQIVNAVPQINGGTIKAYAIGTATRNPALPNLPTSREAGLPEFQASAWNALFAPKGTPKPIVDRLSDALSKALDDEPTRKRLLELGSDIPGKDRRGGGPLLALVKSEIAKWTPVIKAAGPMN